MNKNRQTSKQLTLNKLLLQEVHMGLVAWDPVEALHVDALGLDELDTLAHEQGHRVLQGHHVLQPHGSGAGAGRVPRGTGGGRRRGVGEGGFLLALPAEHRGVEARDGRFLCLEPWER